VGLRRYAPEITKGELRVAILPLRKDAPIYMAKEARPDLGSAESAVALERVEIVPRYQAQLGGRGGRNRSAAAIANRIGVFMPSSESTSPQPRRWARPTLPNCGAGSARRWRERVLGG
jgi:hypothetical protein